MIQTTARTLPDLLSARSTLIIHRQSADGICGGCLDLEARLAANPCRHAVEARELLARLDDLSSDQQLAGNSRDGLGGASCQS
jgi:hypothetical protein